MGSAAHFFLLFRIFWAMPVKLHELLERTLPAMGYELVDCEIHAGGGLVRVFIDKPGGVDVEDCAQVSNHLTHLFAVENIDYGRLEVSSPGLDRPLKKEADFARFDGREAQLKLREPIGNSRRIKGVLRGIDADAGVVRLETADGTHAIPLANIDKARLIPKIEWRNAR
jgi:ribosome maturation factor RimP